MGVCGRGACIISLGIGCEKNGTNCADLSSTSQGGSLQRQDYAAFKGKQLTLVRGRDDGHRPGVKSMSGEGIPSRLVLA